MEDVVRGKENERGKIPSFETINFKELFNKLKEAKDAKKFVFIADMTGKVRTACEYGTGTSVYDFCDDVKKSIVQKT